MTINLFHFSQSGNIVHYQLKTIFEKDLSNPSNSEYSNSLGIESKKFTIIPYPFGPTYAKWYHVPTILYVDKQENIYLNIFNRIEVFNKDGNSILKGNIPDDYSFLDYFSWDNDNFYLFFKKNNEDTETKVYRINIASLSSKKLETKELESLNPDILPPSYKKEMSQVNRYILSITDEKGVFYGQAWTPTDASLFRKSDARYVDPIKITVLRFDASFKKEYTHPLSEGAIIQYPETYNQYVFDKIDIESFFSEKVVCMGLGNSYVDKEGNIYLDGLKSNDAKRILNTEGKCYSIEVEKPIFFLVKLENK